MKAVLLLLRSRTFVVFFSILACVPADVLYGQCTSTPTLSFHSPVLISGVNRQVGAVYRFPNVLPGVDAHVTITGLFGGATLSNIDDSTTGYYHAFQPTVNAAPNDTSYIDWLFTFKKAGTFSDTSLSCLSVTGVDVDGNGSSLREFIEAETPGSISVDDHTILNVSFDGVRSKAVSTVANVALIDTSHREAMFQMNFVNLSSLVYRNGAISTYHSTQTRQTSIYFQKFFEDYQLLSFRLLNFTASEQKDVIQIKWSSGDETNISGYALQKSTDGSVWTEIRFVASAGSNRQYLINDFERESSAVYYRLKWVNAAGSATFSNIIRVINQSGASAVISHYPVSEHLVRLRMHSKRSDDYTIALYTMQGVKLKQQTQRITAGMNTADFYMPSHNNTGVHLLAVTDRNGKRIYCGRVIR